MRDPLAVIPESTPAALDPAQSVDPAPAAWDSYRSYALPSIDKIAQTYRRYDEGLGLPSSPADFAAEHSETPLRWQDPGAPGPSTRGWTSSHTRMNKAFGPLAVGLYMRAEGGDIDAAYRLGVLLCTERRPAEAEFYLDKAARNRNGDAQALLKIGRDKMQHLAVAYARQMGQDHAADDDTGNAVMYLTAAAQQGDTTAAMHLATVLRRLGENDQANRWLTIATMNGSVHTVLPAPVVGKRHAPASHSSVRTQPIDMTGLEIWRRWLNGRGGWCSKCWSRRAAWRLWRPRMRRCRRITATITCRCWTSTTARTVPRCSRWWSRSTWSRPTPTAAFWTRWSTCKPSGTPEPRSSPIGLPSNGRARTGRR